MALSDDDAHELLERRLTEKVTGSVESTLKRRYGWVIGVFLGLYGLGGWALVTKLVSDEIGKVVQAKVQPAINSADEVRAKAVLAEARVRQVETDAGKALGSLEALQKQVSETVAQIDDQVATVNDQVASLGVRLATAETVTQRFEAARGELEKLRETLAAISDATRTLASRADVTIPEVPAVAARPPPTSSTTRRPTTVYFQWGGTGDTVRVRSLADALEAQGFKVPGNERVKTDVREVRYFHAEDREAAERLAKVSAEALEAEGYVQPVVHVRNLTSWARAKPPVGTIELWLDLGTR